MADKKNNEEQDIVYLELEIRDIKPVGHGMTRMFMDVDVSSKMSEVDMDNAVNAFKSMMTEKIEKPTFDEMDMVTRALQAKAFERDADGKVEIFQQMGGASGPRTAGKDLPTMRIHNRLINHIEELTSKGQKKIKIEFHQHAGLIQPKWDDMLELFIVMERYIEEQIQETATWIIEFYDKILVAKTQCEKLIGKK